MSVIYKITCISNDNFYIGATIDEKSRWNTHKIFLNQTKHPNWLLQNDWIKHGEDNFRFDVIDSPEKQFLLGREKYWIEKLNPQYNIIKKSNAGKIRTEYHREQIRKANSNRTKEQRDKMAAKCARTYLFLNPDNQEMTIVNLKKFCRENKLDLSAMLKVNKGKAKSYKGWRKPAI